MDEDEAGETFEAFQQIRDRIHKLEADLGLQAGFHDSLLHDGDEWSFVIKSHALVEAALTHVLSESFKETGISAYLARKNYSEKAHICRVASLLDEKTVSFGFIECLAELRNDVVHDVRQAAFTFRDYASEARTPKDKASARLRRLVPLQTSPTHQPKTLPELRALIADNGRLTVWVNVMMVLLGVYAGAADTRMKRSSAAVRRAILDQMGDDAPIAGAES